MSASLNTFFSVIPFWSTK